MVDGQDRRALEITGNDQSLILIRQRLRNLGTYPVGADRRLRTGEHLARVQVSEYQGSKRWLSALNRRQRGRTESY